MALDSVINAMTPEIFQRLQQAVETGKWPDGSKLSDEQRENSMQAVMLYQAKVLHSEEHMSVGADGELIHKSRQQLKQEMAEQAYSSQPIVRFKANDI
ncbi:DUF1315 family protein [Alteromonadaceae bacterium BrNp21-10]|nr:DUF1315 family protein [Alteromonadaceae bacterium BrNp21-10]